MERMYTTQLQAGLGLLDETKLLFELWNEDLDTSSLYKTALDSGQFPNVSARRLRNIIAECFAPRYLANDAVGAKQLQPLLSKLRQQDIKQLFFIYTARANYILRAFVEEIYWASYAGGANVISMDQARQFVLDGCQQGKTSKFWSESTIKRVGSYVVGACVDFGLLDSHGRQKREILPYHIESAVALYLAYDLHLQGLSDNAIISHEDWRLFGFEISDIKETLKRLSLQGHFVMQSAADTVHISWKYKTWEEVANVID